MQKLLSIQRGDGFFGAQYFHDPEGFHQFDIDPHIYAADEVSEEGLQGITDEHPEEDVGAILTHRLSDAKTIVELELYEDVPLCLGAHVTPVSPSPIDKWKTIVESGREIFVFAGAVRTGRTFNIPGADNLQIVIAPIMGLSIGKPGRIPDNFLEDPEKEYDIGFFSVRSFKKRPHTVLETANQVAEELGRDVSVWLGGHPRDGAYKTLLTRLIEDNHYGNLDIDDEIHIPNKTLFEKVQKTHAMYLPLVKPSETTCYSAWETITHDTALIGTDWAGIGEAIQASRHPHSTAVPVHRPKHPTDVFPDSVKDAYPALVEQTIDHTNSPVFAIDEAKAKHAVLRAIQNDANHDREFQVPEQVRVETTIAAFADILSGELSLGMDVDSDIVTHSQFDIMKTSKGYSLLRDPFYANPFLGQTTPVYPPSEERDPVYPSMQRRI